MSRTIVLVRHGKAEKGRAGLRDEDRSLTEAGIAALAAAYPQTLKLLAGPSAGDAPTAEAAPFDLWVSPALRARQTAERVASALAGLRVPARAPRELECLLHQDYAAFLDELAATPDGSRMIAVGHIPFMEDALERLTGATISFKPGAVACCTVSGNVRDFEPGRLEWFMQGPRA